MCFSGFHAGNLLGLILSPILLITFGWRALFLVFGMLGGPLLAMWMAVVPNHPPASIPGAPPQTGSTTSSSGSGAASFGRGSGAIRFGRGTGGSAVSTPVKGVSVGQMLSKSATWAIIVVNVVNHWGYFIYLNWMPTYFVKALGFDLRSSSLMAFLPWMVMAVGSSLSGLLADTLVSRGVNVTTVRKSVQTVAFLVPAVALMLLSQPGLSPQVAVGLMTVALGTTSLGQAGFVANMSDIAPRQAGQMFGLCNTFGSLSGILGVTAVGFIVEATKSFSPVFQLTAGMYVLGTAVWLWLCTGEQVFE
mmetsp:Transcript_17093/g.29254  ORF Transcript_17093/g.29254 Transcript_17093/m.29254 type:complete len:305 (-) Transcript_17093:149-1063(-)